MEPSDEWAKLLRAFAATSSMQGLPRAVLAKSRFGKLFWLLLFLAGFSVCCWCASDSIKKYLSYPVRQTALFSYEGIPRPRVSLCYWKCFADQIYEAVSKVVVVDSEPVNISNFKESLRNTAHYEFLANYSRYKQRIDEKFKFNDPCRQCMLSEIGLRAVSSATLTLRDKLSRFGCVVGRKGSSVSRRPDCDVEAFFDPKHGSCVTMSDSTEQQFIETIGSGYLMYVTFKKFKTNASSSKFMKDFHSLYSADGATVAIHDTSRPPYGIQLDSSFTILPRTLVKIGINVRRFERLGPPYGECSDKYATEYDVTRCEGECLQRQLVQGCRCKSVDVVGWDLGTYDDYSFCEDLEELNDRCKDWVQKCDDSDKACVDFHRCVSEQMECADRIVSQLSNIACDCPQPCMETRYDHSLTVYPLSDAAELLGKLLDDFVGGRNIRTEDISLVRVYLEDKYVLVIKDEEDYPFSQLLGDLGGQIGLFIGLSLLSFGEVFEFIIRIIRYYCIVRRRRKATEKAKESEDDYEI